MKRLARIVCSSFCILLAVSALGPAARADPQANLRASRQELLARQREHYQQSLRRLPVLNEHRMIRVMQLAAQNGRLVLHTALQPKPNFISQRAQIDGLDCPAVVTYTQYVPDNPRARQFEFTLEDYPNPQTYDRVHLLWRPGWPRDGELSIEKTEQSADGFARVFFSQTANHVRLITFGDEDVTGHNPMQAQNLVEKDFATLRQKHPSETNQWLRPIFRRLRQDAAFAPDPNAAWQVLRDQWPLDPKVQAAVRRLLPSLDCEQSRIRNHTAGELASLGRDGAAAILHLNRGGLSVEQNLRLDQVVSQFSPLSPDDVRRLQNDPEFLLDCEFCDDLIVRRLAAARLSRILGHPLDLDPRATGAVRDEMIERARRLDAR